MAERLISKTMKTVVEEDHTAELSREDILDLLRAKLRLENVSDENLPNDKDAEVYVQIPGGGDWSNTRMEVGKDTYGSPPLKIRWKIKKER